MGSEKCWANSYSLLATLFSITEDRGSERRSRHGFNEMNEHLSESHTSRKFSFLLKVNFQNNCVQLGQRGAGRQFSLFIFYSLYHFQDLTPMIPSFEHYPESLKQSSLSSSSNELIVLYQG